MRIETTGMETPRMEPKRKEPTKMPPFLLRRKLTGSLAQSLAQSLAPPSHTESLWRPIAERRLTESRSGEIAWMGMWHSR